MRNVCVKMGMWWDETVDDDSWKIGSTKKITFDFLKSISFTTAQITSSHCSLIIFLRLRLFNIQVIISTHIQNHFTFTQLTKTAKTPAFTSFSVKPKITTVNNFTIPSMMFIINSFLIIPSIMSSREKNNGKEKKRKRNENERGINYLNENYIIKTKSSSSLL